MPPSLDGEYGRVDLSYGPCRDRHDHWYRNRGRVAGMDNVVDVKAATPRCVEGGT